MIEILQYDANDTSSPLVHPSDVVSVKDLPSAQVYNAAELMKEAMLDQDEGLRALGLSAVQINLPIRLIVVLYGSDYIWLVNPYIAKCSEQTFDSREGCFSINTGHSQFWVARYKRIKVKAFTPDGYPITIKVNSHQAAPFQHEIDHTNGILICNKHKEQRDESKII